MDYIILLVLTIVAVDWFIRIVVYARTKNEKCKHQHLWWLK